MKKQRHSLMHRSIVLDSETLGLNRGVGTHEISWVDVDLRHVQEFILQANAVAVQARTAQERTGLASAYADTYTARPAGGTWPDVIHEQVEAKVGLPVSRQATMNFVQQQQPWLAEQIPRHPHLLNPAGESAAATAARKAKFKKHGFTSSLNQQGTIEDVIRGPLKKAMEGKTVWIANAAFESKQIGATLGAMGQDAADAFKSNLETRNPKSPDPFYVTGTEVTKSRVLSQQTGDWTHTWRAYKANAPKVGETAVRDIQDVVRAVHSYGHKLGLTSGDLSYMGTSVDASHRMLAIAAGDDERLNMKETHRAAEDAALHEEYVLDKSTAHAQVLQDVAEGTDAGKAHLLSAGRGEGPLPEISKYFATLEAHGPAFMEEQLVKRLGRAHEDLAAGEGTYQRIGDRPYMQEQLDPSGAAAKTYRSAAHRQRFDDIDQLTTHLDAEGRYSRYGASAAAVQEQMLPHAGDPNDLRQYVHARTKELRSSWDDVQIPTGSSRLRGLQRSSVANAAAEIGTSLRGGGKYLAAGAGVLGFMGAAVGLAQKPPEQQGSIMHYGYRDWENRNRIEGMSEGTVASQQRHAMTDFGSPYRGPVGVEQVFVDQELMREREKWMRSQYGASHYDPEQGVFGVLRQFKFGSGRSFIRGGHHVRGEDYGLRGNLMAINMNDGGWKMTVEDADTVVLKRGGVRGALSSFFGFNRGYGFRLAGIDSTETSHGSTSYHAPQPYAEDAATAVRSMIRGSTNVQLVYDPSQTTYGRMMGAVVADGRNVNFQIVQQGLAAHLPFGNPMDSIIDYRGLKKAEEKAYGAGRGMWSTPWARAFYEHSEGSGERVTFNTLAKTSSIVQNSGTMGMLSLMEGAQRNGAFTERDSMIAREMGGSYHTGADHVEPFAFVAPSAPSNSYLHEQLQDLSQFTKTKGTGGKQNKFSRHGGYGKLDQTMALDTLGSSDNIWTRRRYASFDTYQSTKVLGRIRKERMAAQQRQALRQLNSSPIGHHRM